MTVSSITSVAAGVVQRSLGTSKSSITQSVKTLLSGGADTSSSVNAPKLSEAITLQTQSSSLRSASLGIARTAAQVSEADNGAASIERALTRMKELSKNASDENISADVRRALDSEFQALRADMKRTIETTRFENTSLLDGSVSARDLGLESDDPSAGLPNLSEQALFGGASLSLGDASSAANANAAIDRALPFVALAREDIRAFADALEQGAASLESALQNFEASRSTLGDEDFGNGMNAGIASLLQNDVNLSAEAQTRLMPANIILLIAE